MKVFAFFIQTGVKENHSPRLIGEILTDYFSTSNEALAVSLRERKQSLVINSKTESHGRE